MEKKNIVKEKSFQFALQMIELYKYLRANKEYIISNQLLRSGTSIGANIEEDSAAVSRKDFINKMAIASKEAKESYYWLRLLEKSNYVPADYTNYLTEVEAISKIITSIIKTCQERELKNQYSFSKNSIQNSKS